MIGQIKDVISYNYATYVNAITLDKEGHRCRLTIQVIVGLCLALAISELSDNNIAVIITSLSILAGFAFSAMFPIASDINANLRKPEFSEDYDDLKRLSSLASSFRANVSYFIPLTMIAIVIFTIQMLDIKSPKELGFGAYFSNSTIE